MNSIIQEGIKRGLISNAENIILPILSVLEIGRLPFCNLNHKSITFLTWVPKIKLL